VSIDSSPRPFYNTSESDKNILKENLTTFLTYQLPKKRRSVIEKCVDVILALYSRQNFEWHAAGIASYYGKDRRHYIDHINLLVSLGVVSKKQRIDGFVPIILNHNVVKQLKKIERGMGSYSNTKLSRRKINNKLSGKASNVRSHRIMATYTHSLSSKQFSYLAKRYGIVNGRVKSDIVFEDKHFVLLWFKDKVQIHTPVYYSDLEDFSVIDDRISSDLGRLTVYLERKYLMPGRMELKDAVKYEYVNGKIPQKTIHGVRKEVEVQHPFLEYVADLIQSQNSGPVIYPDWKSMPKYPGIEFNGGYTYDGCEREGYGDQLFDELLHFPETFERYWKESRASLYATNIHVDQVADKLLIKLENIESKVDNYTDVLDDIQYELTDLKQQNDFSHEYLRYQNNIIENKLDKSLEASTEIIRGINRIDKNNELYTEQNRAEIQLLHFAIEVQKQKFYESPFEKKCNDILSLLEDGPVSYKEIAEYLKLTQAAVSRYLNYLEINGKIESYRKKIGRGRPIRIFKIKGDDKN